MPVAVLYSRVTSQQPGEPVLVIHGGAGPRSTELALQGFQNYERGLASALRTGSAGLAAGRSALDAVCAAATMLEDDPLFNAGRGASLTADGTVELDASVMTGAGHAGAVAASRQLRNPVLGARAVMERTDHVLLVDPSADLLTEWELETAPPEYFVTDHRRRQLDEVLADRAAEERTGTVGAVAVDTEGHVACATSTGGMVGQSIGRIGDTPLIGAGSYAADDAVAVSCTGEGEAYIRGVVAHDIAARLRYGKVGLHEAVRATYETHLEARGATGGTIAVTPAGEALIAYNSKAMFAGYWTPTGQQTFS